MYMRTKVLLIQRPRLQGRTSDFRFRECPHLAAYPDLSRQAHEIHQTFLAMELSQ